MSTSVMAACCLCGEKPVGPYPNFVAGTNVCGECAESVANAYSKCHSGKWLTWKEDSPPPRGKAVISRTLAKKVFERDAYRCVSCGGYMDLTCDHVLAESKGGETSFENLRTMCRSCNAKKGAK